MNSNYLFTNQFSGTSLTTEGNGGCVLALDDSVDPKWEHPLNQVGGVTFTTDPNRYQLFLLKLLGFNPLKSKPQLSEEEIINNRRKEILGDILKRKWFKW